MERVTPFSPELVRVTPRFGLKVTTGPTPPENHVFGRQVRSPRNVEAVLPSGQTYFHAMYRPQVLQYVISLAKADLAVVPPWTGEIHIIYRPSQRELSVTGRAEVAIPEEAAAVRLSEYCQSVMTMLAAYAQLPGTPTFEILVEATGSWEARRGDRG